MAHKKIKLLLLFVSVQLSLTMVISCEKDKNEKQAEKTRYFLSDIRPNFFANINFLSPEVISNIPGFSEDFFHTFNKLEQEFKEGRFKSEEDIYNFRLASVYYGFYLTALTSNYLDGNLSLSQINGNRSTGLFSGLSSTTPDFEVKEMEAMSSRATTAIEQAVTIGNTTDQRTYGFFLICNLVKSRLFSKQDKADPEVHTRLVDFTSKVLTNLNYVPVWNVIMAPVMMTNYNDSLNTFANPHMDYLFSNMQSRLYPGSLPDLGGKLPEIVGPIYRFDLLLKKIDWMLKSTALSDVDRSTVELYLTIMDTIISYVENDKKAVLDTWPLKHTLEARKDRLKKLKQYLSDITHTTKPDLKGFINSKEFKMAYQCYSCHRKTGF